MVNGPRLFTRVIGAEVHRFGRIRWTEEPALLDLLRLHDRHLGFPLFAAHATLFDLFDATITYVFDPLHLEVHSVVFIAKGLRYVFILVESH